MNGIKIICVGVCTEKRQAFDLNQRCDDRRRKAETFAKESNENKVLFLEKIA